MDRKIKANEYLFYKWVILGTKISSLNGIIQNDMIIDEKNITEWYDNATGIQDELEDLIDQTLYHINKEGK
jgi:hypothetical protein